MGIDKEYFSTPVVLITFNRPNLVRNQIEQLRIIKPSKLFFVSDAAREGHDQEKVRVEETRSQCDSIDWNCDLEKIYADKNMGCDNRIVSALNVVFSKVSKAIILEDDCFPNLSFFTYCDALLKKYENNHEIMYISGTKLAPHYPMEYSYGFSYATGTWGWATWARAWKEWHWNEKEWNEKKAYLLKDIYSSRHRKKWIKDFERYIDREQKPWDYVWKFCVGNRLSIFPAENLVSNKGFGDDATHTKEKMYGYDSNTKEIPILYHPLCVEGDKEYPKYIEKQFTVPLSFRVRRKIKKILFSVLPKIKKDR